MNPLRATIVAVAVFVAAVLVVIAGAAYSGSGAWAAVVNGHEISERDLLDELAELRTNEALAEQIPGLTTGSKGSVPGALAATWLGRMIEGEVFRQIAEDDDIEITADDRREAEQLNIQQFSGEEGWNSLSEWFRARQVDRTATSLAVIRASGGRPTEAELREAYEARGPDLLRACTSIITGTTLEEALAAKARVDAGEDFAAVAQEVSQDPFAAQGGDAGCNPRGGLGVEPLDSEIFTVPLDVASEPIETQFGFHVIKVASRDVAAFEDVRAELEQEAQGDAQDRVRSVLFPRFGNAEYQTNPKYCSSYEVGIDGPQCVPVQAPQPPDRLPTGRDETSELIDPGIFPGS